MSKTASICALLVSIGSLVTISVCAPWVLSDDSNSFLKNFVNHEMLGFLGVIVTITLASTATLHLELNKLEEAAQIVVFGATRRKIHLSAYSLIAALILAFVLVVTKPLFGSSAIATSLVNSGAIIIILFNVLVLFDITKSAFALKANVRDDY